MTAAQQRSHRQFFKQDDAVRVALFVIDAGAGHRATANAILDYVPESEKVEIAFVNPYKDVLSNGNFLDRRIAANSEAQYNFLLRTSRLPQILWILLAKLPIVFRKIRKRSIARLLRRFYAEQQPDLVICVLPFIGIDVIVEADKAGIPNMMVVTDHSETYKYSWIPRRAGHLVSFSERGCEQARRRKHIAQVSRLSGPVIRQAFFQRRPDYVSKVSARFGFDVEKKTVLVFYGGNGSPEMISIARALEAVGDDINAVFVCGHNGGLKRDLTQLPTSYSKRVFGFVRNVQLLMEVSDLMIGKPGPGSAFEAVAKGLATILEVNGQTMPHELANADHISEHWQGRTFDTRTEMIEAVRAVISERPATGKQPPFRSDIEFSEIFSDFIAQSKEARRNAAE